MEVLRASIFLNMPNAFSNEGFDNICYFENDKNNEM